MFRDISSIQELLSPEDETKEPNYERAKIELDRLNERYNSLNDFEKATLLNFYTNYYLNTDNIEQALLTFERMLTIENLRVEMRQRALQALGNLYAGEERWQDSIDALSQWREISEEESANVFLQLANGHFNLEQFQQAIPYVLDHMEIVRAEGREVPRNVYGLLNVMYIEMEDYPNALITTKEMVALFDEPADWRNLAAIYGMLDDDKNRIETLGLTFAKGYMASEAEYMNLAQSLAGIDAPYKGAKVLEAGIAAGIVEEDFDTFERLTQMYLMANEYDEAVIPARKAAELDETGNGYDYLGYIYYLKHDYKEAAEASKLALQRGNLDDPDDANLFLARALLEIEDFEGARQAAREAQRLGNNNASQLLTFIENSKARRENLDRRKADAIDFYRS
ncbi:MAG: hypothetical protein RQ757_08705 [Pseudomonadales bacterium]|nr:hypothetical protein [Pseudomonadales bacterium]